MPTRLGQSMSCDQKIAALEAELEHQRLLSAELQHRSRNSFAIVQSIIAQTLTDNASLKEARVVLQDRVGAMARANGLLTEAEWKPMPIAHAVSSALIHLHQFRSRFEIAGQALTIGPKAAMILAMALHELETNAIKYGALSGDTGTVRLQWCVVKTGVFELSWNEQGGPPVQEPDRKGFGTRLIGEATARSLQGTAELCYAPTGISWTIKAPLSVIEDARIG